MTRRTPSERLAILEAKEAAARAKLEQIKARGDKLRAAQSNIERKMRNRQASILGGALLSDNASPELVQVRQALIASLHRPQDREAFGLAPVEPAGA